jgi:hypothetical protein
VAGGEGGVRGGTSTEAPSEARTGHGSRGARTGKAVGIFVDGCERVLEWVLGGRARLGALLWLIGDSRLTAQSDLTEDSQRSFICAAAVYESAKWPEVVPSLSARRRNARIPPWRLAVLLLRGLRESVPFHQPSPDPPAHAWGRQQPSRHSRHPAVMAAWWESAGITLSCSSRGPVPIEPRALAVCVSWYLTWLDMLSTWACFGTHARAHVNAALASKTLSVCYHGLFSSSAACRRIQRAL